MSLLPMALAVDIGGTSAKLALVTHRPRPLVTRTLPTGPRASPRRFLHRLTAALQELRREARQRGGRPLGVGVGVPGVVDSRRGLVRYLVNIPGWRQVPLGRVVGQALRLPTRVDNDVNAMTWGEFRYGAGRGARSVVCVTLGTGVGGGLILEGRLHRGWTMSAGEIGHWPMGRRGRRCPCGGRACLERYIGNRAILARARSMARAHPQGQLAQLARQAGGLTPPLIDRAARQGDPDARALWRAVGEDLGLALAGVVNVVNPERIVIGGGIAKAGRWLFPAIRAVVRARAMRGASAVAIVPSRWGADAGLIGAAALVLAPPEHTSEEPA